MTQKQFAGVCGVSASTIQRGEAGERWSKKTLEKMGRGLSIFTGHEVNPDDVILAKRPSRLPWAFRKTEQQIQARIRELRDADLPATIETVQTAVQATVQTIEGVSQDEPAL